MSDAVADLPAILATAAELERSGRPLEALRAYEQALNIEPHCAATLRGRANALVDLGRVDEALADYARSLELEPDACDTYDFRGIALAQAGRLLEALASFDRAVALDPANMNAQGNRANLLKMLGRPQDAVESLNLVLADRPDFAPAHFNRANVLLDLGRLGEAVEGYRSAVELDPGFRTPVMQLLQQLINKGRTTEVIAIGGALLELDPDDAGAHVATALAFKAQRRFVMATRHLLRAALLTPDALEQMPGFDTTVEELGRVEEARDKDGQPLTQFAKAKLHQSLGTLLKRVGHTPEALASYDRALALAPDIPELLGLRVHIAMHIHAWDGLDDDLRQLAGCIEQGQPASPNFAMLALIDDPALHRRLADLLAADYAAKTVHMGDFPEGRAPGRIRIGYVSRDFHDHATMRLMAEMFETHDHQPFEWFAYSFGPPRSDEMRQRAISAFDHFVDIEHLTDEQAVRRIRDDQLDIAIDLKGLTAHCRPDLFALRLAPVQVNYLGYPGTMGSPFADYIIADPVIVPDQLREHYAEALVRLPESYQPNCRWSPPGPPPPRSAHGLPQEGFVFCSFNQAYKITPEMFDCWLEILRECPGSSVLWLWSTDPVGQANLRIRATAAGIDPQRLIFAASLQGAEHLQRLQCADLMLDTLPYNAHTTASDALRAGLPILTAPGRSFAARVAASLLTAADLPELIVPDLAAYSRRAVEIATDPDLCRKLKAKVLERASTSSLFDPVAAARSLESAYEIMFERSQAGLPPADIDLQAPSRS